VLLSYKTSPEISRSHVPRAAPRFGRDLPALPPRLAAHSVVAALLAWPVISGYGYTTGYSLSVGVLATEILIGAVFLAVAIVTARRWAIRADLIQRPRLCA
jgi:hypothetical protein